MPSYLLQPSASVSTTTNLEPIEADDIPVERSPTPHPTPHPKKELDKKAIAKQSLENVDEAYTQLLKKVPAAELLQDRQSFKDEALGILLQHNGNYPKMKTSFVGVLLRLYNIDELAKIFYDAEMNLQGSTKWLMTGLRKEITPEQTQRFIEKLAILNNMKH
ncbi:unnamed protein product [Peronospora belbahrii]|uniref:Uncharacterized protein n=1 Tax=Peronospora belbahrii TaxID=622444 RepID=A0ABN8D520_9STRA|nr:unnamed protein product [Peronospora belbahrii]